MKTKQWTVMAVALAASLALAACGGGGSSSTVQAPGGGGGTVTPTPPPTAYEAGLAAIQDADTAAAAQAAYDAVDQTAIDGAEAAKLQAALTTRLDMLATAARVTAQKMALATAAGDVDTSDLTTADAIVAANTAIAALEAALAAAADVSDADKAMYQSQLTDAKEAVATAQTGLDKQGRMTTQRAAITSAVTAARTAVNAVNNDSTDAQVTAADSAVAALKAAIDGAADLPEGDADVASAQGTLTTLEGQLSSAKTSRTAAMDKKADDAKKAMAAAGKALKAALRTDPLAWLGGDLDTNTDGDQIASLDSSGLKVNVSNRAATPALTASPTMKAGASAGSLGSWAGMNYAHKNAGTGVSNSAVVYTNRAAAKTYPIATRYAGANKPANAGDYTAASRMLALGTAADSNIKADMFPTAGKKTFTPTAPSSEILVPGTYQGAAGDYRCTGTCEATAGASGVITLTADWVFIHDSGASVSVKDPNYLYFGWWLRKDKDDKPTAASAFTGVVGTIDALTDNPSALSGKATYSGHAAGKFAIHDPLNGTGDAGHFTADATLNATFGGGATNGLSGTLDNFMANEQSVPWSVTLFRRAWDTGNAGATINTDDTNTAGVNESVTQTVWSIGGNSAAASGTWNAMAYDEKPGNPPTGDGSNVATSVTGTFQSHYGSTHTMVGAFGATKD